MEIKNKENLNNSNIYKLMFILVIAIEVVNIVFSVVTESFRIDNIYLLIIYCILWLIFKFKYNYNKESVRVFASITLGVLFVYILLYIFIDEFCALLIGLYLVEVAVILNFSRFKLRNKLLIHTVFGVTLGVGFMVFNLYSAIVENTSFYVVAFYILIFAELIAVDKIVNIFRELIDKNEKQIVETSITNDFLSTVLEKEEVYLLYYYPQSQEAQLVTNNFPAGVDRYLPNLLDFITASDLVTNDGVDKILSAIKKVETDGFAEINIPIQLVDSNHWIIAKFVKMSQDKTDREKIIISITSISDLEKMKLKFQNALDKSTISIWEYDIKNDVINNYSDSLLSNYFSSKNISNASQTLIDKNIIYFSDIDVYNKGMEKIRNGENNVTFEIRVFPSSSSAYSWMRFNFTCFKDFYNYPTVAWVTVENIADAKSSQNLLEIERKQKSEDRDGLLVVLELNVSREIILNHNFYFDADLDRNFDRSLNNLIDAYINSGVIIDNKDDFYQRLSQQFLLSSYENGKRVLEYKYKVITQLNDVYYITNVIKLFFDVKTKEVIAFVFFYDSTQSAILNMTVDSILQTKFVYWATVNMLNNSMSVRSTQLYKAESDTSQFRDYKKDWQYIINRFVYPEDRDFVAKNVDLENVKHQLKTKKSFSFDFRISDSGNMVAKRRCYFIKSGENSPYVTILEENITSEMVASIKHELDLKKALALSKAADSAKSEFLSRISHEIRTPLSAIMGLSELGITAKKEETVDFFNRINDSGQYLLTLLNDILEMNKLELGKIKLFYEFIDTQEVCKTILNIAKIQANRKKIDFKFITKGEVLRYQYVDKIRLQQVIINILNNAIKYTPSGGKVTYTINNIREADNKYYAIHTIQDTGVGISKDFINQVFNPFAREKNLLSDTEGGTGLGLAICYNLVKNLKGDITIDSELNEGTLVTIKLPIYILPTDKFLKKMEQFSVIKSNSPFAGKKALIAEDQQINAMILSSILTKKGMRVDHVLNGEEAVAKFSKSKEGEYDIVLLDIMMPKLNGLDAAKQIRALKRKDNTSIPIIALSANAFEEDVKKSLKHGMDDHLKKPIETDVLINTLNKFL